MHEGSITHDNKTEMWAIMVRVERGEPSAYLAAVEMLEAAALDGAGLIMTLRKVVAPVALPGLAATALIAFIFSWNECCSPGP